MLIPHGIDKAVTHTKPSMASTPLQASKRRPRRAVSLVAKPFIQDDTFMCCASDTQSSPLALFISPPPASATTRASVQLHQRPEAVHPRSTTRGKLRRPRVAGGVVRPEQTHVAAALLLLLLLVGHRCLRVRHSLSLLACALATGDGRTVARGS